MSENRQKRHGHFVPQNRSYGDGSAENKPCILVVEDDQQNRDGLAFMIKEYEPDAVVFTASNVFTAQHILNETELSLIFLDIRLQSYNGLDLLEWIRDNYGDIPTVITSAYDEFEYAIRAIHYHVVDYLLKPLRSEQIYDILQMTLHHKKAKSSTQYSPAIIEQWMRNPLLMNDIIDKVLDCEPDCMGRLILIRSNPSTQQQQERTAEIGTQIFERLRETIEQTEIKKAYVYQYGVIMCVLVLDEQDAFVITSLYRRIEDILHEIRIETDMEYSAAVSDPVWGILDRIQQVYRDTMLLLDYSFFLEDEEIITTARIGRQEYAALNETIFMPLRKAETQIQVKEAIEGIFNIEYYGCSMQEFLYHVHMEILSCIQRLISVDEVRSELEAKLSEIMRFSCSKSKMRTKLIGLTDGMLDQSTDSNKHIIQKCIELIDSQYGDFMLDLSQVAKYYHFSPTYFGTIFKRYTGEGFSQYLTKVRIEKACEYLLKTDKKIYEIAQKCGFQDPRYFIRVFHKIVGKSPSQYRRKEC